jgi:hypothetical protein
MLFGRDLSTQVEQQISRRRFEPELPDHSHDLPAMHSCMIDDVLHLIDEAHRARIAAEKLEWKFGVEPVFMQVGNKLGPPLNHNAPMFPQYCQVPARVG